VEAVVIVALIVVCLLVTFARKGEKPQPRVSYEDYEALLRQKEINGRKWAEVQRRAEERAKERGQGFLVFLLILAVLGIALWALLVALGVQEIALEMIRGLAPVFGVLPLALGTYGGGGDVDDMTGCGWLLVLGICAGAIAAFAINH
jgi:hypothetical protein